MPPSPKKSFCSGAILKKKKTVGTKKKCWPKFKSTEKWRTIGELNKKQFQLEKSYQAQWCLHGNRKPSALLQPTGAKPEASGLLHMRGRHAGCWKDVGEAADSECFEIWGLRGCGRRPPCLTSVITRASRLSSPGMHAAEGWAVESHSKDNHWGRLFCHMPWGNLSSLTRDQTCAPLSRSAES